MGSKPYHKVVALEGQKMGIFDDAYQFDDTYQKESSATGGGAAGLVK
jgi:hypothetical protein